MIGRWPLPALHRVERPLRRLNGFLVRFEAPVPEGDRSRHGEVPGWKGVVWHLVSQGREGGDGFVERLVLQIPQGDVCLRHERPRALDAEPGHRPPTAPGTDRAPLPPRRRQPNQPHDHQEPEERPGESRLMTTHAWSLRRNSRGGRRTGHLQGTRQPVAGIP